VKKQESQVISGNPCDAFANVTWFFVNRFCL